MYATALLCEEPAGIVPGVLRSRGRLALHARLLHGRTVPDRIEEEGPSRIRFPAGGRRAGALEGILLNTGGGVASGDHFATRVNVEAGARLVLTSQAAEKCYRSDGGRSRLAVELSVASEASLDWLPQPTILFDGVHMHRSISAEVAAAGRLLVAESVVLGRTARGERFVNGAFGDSWRIRREGRLIYADGLSLGGPRPGIAGATLSRNACARDWAGFATLLLVSPDVEARLEEARAAADALMETREDVEIGVSAWDGMLCARLLARDGAPLDVALRRLIRPFGVAQPPRIWHF